ncbi:MAG: SPOR domain-containing protein [Sphingomonadales bacterium]|jgi:hypothetical protein
MALLAAPAAAAAPRRGKEPPPATSAEPAAPAASVKRGVELWRAGDWPGAVAMWQPFADQGDPDAMFNIGQAYKLGRGVAQDRAQALVWYRKAAARGHLPAQANLGILLFQGGDKAESLRWLKMAADRGEMRAQYVLGVVHWNGDGAPRSLALAWAYLNRSATQELPEAKTALGNLDAVISAWDRTTGQQIAASLAAGKGVPPQFQPDRIQMARAPQAGPRNLGPAPPVAMAFSAAGDGPPRPGSSNPFAPLPGAVQAAATPAQPAPLAPLPPLQWAFSRAGDGPPTSRATLAMASARPAATPPRPVPSFDLAFSRAGDGPPPGALVIPARPPAGVRGTAPVATAKVKAEEPVADNGNYRIQLGAYAKRAQAEAAWTALKKKQGRQTARLKPFYGKDSRLVLLQLGPFKDKDDARAACGKLSIGRNGCLVVEV